MALRHRLTAGVLFVLALAVAGAGLFAVRGALAGPAGCGRPDPVQSALIAAVAVGAFGLGHLGARYRTAGETVSESRHPLATAILVRGALAAVLLLLVIVLVYETAALLGLDGLRPVTEYVRCARSAQPLVTGLAAGVISFLAGRWLWYPAARAR